MPTDILGTIANLADRHLTAAGQFSDELIPWSGVLVVEGVTTGDGRLMEEGSLRWDDGPWPLRWVREDVGAHANAVMVGRIDSMERLDTGEIWGTGVIDPTIQVDGDTPVRLMLNEMPLGVSVDLDDVSFDIRVAEHLLAEGDESLDAVDVDEDGRHIVIQIDPDDELFVVTDARIRAATLVDVPAFSQARIELDDPDSMSESFTAAVTGDLDLPIADRDREWDGSAAAQRVFEFCALDGDDVPDTAVDPACASRAFLLRRDDVDPETRGAYSLGFVDVVDGELQIVPRGVFAAAGGRGVDAVEGISGDERDRIKARICTLYERLADHFEDDEIVCPFMDDMAGETFDLDGDPEIAEHDAAIAETLARLSGDTLTADAGDGHAMIALLPANADALTVEGGDPAERLHVTLCFLGDAENAQNVTDEHMDTLAEMLFGDGQVAATVAGFGSLGGEEPPATVLLLNGDKIAEAHAFASTLTDVDQHTPYIAHLTVGYGVPVESVATLRGETFMLDRVALVAGNETISERSFGSHDEDEMTASAVDVPSVPPSGWFSDPKFDKPTKLTVEDGRVYGHAFLWDSCHRAFDQCVKPPKSRTEYAHFLTGQTRTDEGRFATGCVTLGTGHAGKQMSATQAAWHYENSGSVVADVTMGEDRFGGWVAGALRPGVTEAQVRELEGCPLSGDWRRVGGSLELIGLLAVPVPGFPIVASAYMQDGEVECLIATAEFDDEPSNDPVELTPTTVSSEDSKIVSQLVNRERQRRKSAIRDATLRAIDVRRSRVKV